MKPDRVRRDDGGEVVVVPFARPAPPPPRMTIAERIQTLRWAAAASQHGVRAVRIHEPEPGDPPDVNGFVLVYRQAELWASWGVAVGPHRYEVWRPASGVTVGCFPTLGEALRAIQNVA